MQNFATLGLLTSLDRVMLEERAVGLLECLADHDIDQAMTFLSPKARVFLGADQRAMPFFGSYEGQDGLRQALREIHIEYDVLSQDIRDILVDGDRVVARRTCRMRHRGTAKVMDVDFCDWIQFEGGFVFQLSLMPETLALAELVA
jgi:ketosteroid isomerase-like protein